MHILTFRLSIFGDYKQFTPTTANTIAWTQALQKAGYEFLPNIIQAPQQVINLPFVPMQIGPNDKRMQFVSQNGEISIRILSERVDIEFTQGATDNTEQYFADKLPAVSEMMKVILGALGDLKGNRMAYFVDALIPEPDGKTFDGFYQKNNLEISMNNASDVCVEWNHRFNRRVLIDIDGTEELSNAILILESGVLQTVNATTGEQQTIKGLHISADINTVAENKSERFTQKSVDSFAANAQAMYLNILQQVKAKLVF